MSAKIFLVVASVFNSMCESSTIQIFAIMKKKMELMLKFAVIKTKEKELGHDILCFFPKKILGFLHACKCQRRDISARAILNTAFEIKLRQFCYKEALLQGSL